MKKDTIIADSGFWIGLIDDHDRHHGQICQFLRSLNTGLITTFPVVTEVCHLLLKRVGSHGELAFIRALQRSSVEVFSLQSSYLPRMHDLIMQYANLPMDFADASLVILAEHLGHGRILSTDQRDFHAYKWKNHHPFQNLLLP